MSRNIALFVYNNKNRRGTSVCGGISFPILEKPILISVLLLRGRHLAKISWSLCSLNEPDLMSSFYSLQAKSN